MRNVATILVFAAAPAVFAQGGVQTGAQVASFRSSVDGSQQPYALYVPRSFDGSASYPLVIGLHSEDMNYRMNLRQIFGLSIRSGEANPEDLRYFPARDAGFLVACPFGRGTMDYRGIAERDVFDMLAEVERRFRVDPDRIYLTGISMGGAAALRLALTQPGRWAAVAAICPAPLAGLEALASNAVNLPVRLYHGDQDPIVPVQNSRQWQRMLVDAGVAAGYVEYPGLRHNAWDIAYRNGAIFDWFAKFRRNASPESVRLLTQSYRDASAYWVRIDGMTPGMPADIRATRTASGGVGVKTSNVDGFTLTLDGVAAVSVDGAILRIRPGQPLSFSKAGGKWRVGRFVPAGKRPGLEGPVADAVAGRHIYVYGTVGANEETLEARKREAETAAAWSGARGARPIVTFPVKADSAVTEEDFDTADLVLFGTRDTNAVIARLAPKLPLALNPGAADYGLLFVAPAGKHYVLISSGLPWWTGGEEARRGGPALASEQLRVLSTFGDYVVFKGSIGNVVDEGRFDGNWKVPAAAASKLLASGTVTVQ